MARTSMIVKLIRPDPSHPDISIGCLYAVIGVEADDLRIINDEGRPFLYPASIFETIDSNEPADWISEIGESGERYAYPPALNAPGFFEDVHEGNKQAARTFWSQVNRQLAQSRRQKPPRCSTA